MIGFSVKEDTVKAMTADDLNKLEKIEKESIYELLDSSKGLFYFEKLDDEQKYLYAEIEYVLLNMLSDIQLSSNDTKLIDRCFKYVMYDNPEIFYVDGFLDNRYKVGDSIKAVTFSGSYIMQESMVEAYENVCEAYVNDFLSNVDRDLPKDADDYERIKYTYEYIIRNTDYVSDSDFNQSMISVFTYRKSVCQGYAKAMQYLLNRQGIMATLVSGIVGNGTGHAWNLVRCDSEYYYVDCTWGDASYSTAAGNMKNEESLPPVNYDYLLITTSELEKTHKIDEDLEVPLCTARKDNYYVREGLYFISLDENQLSEVFDRAYRNGEEFITLKMSDIGVYDQLWKYLLESQNIFEYLRDCDYVSYVENKEQLYMTFWI